MNDINFTTLHDLISVTGIIYVSAITVMICVFYAMRHVTPIFFLVVLPATVVHEMSHLIVALFLNGRPDGFSIIPQRSVKGYTLGSVACANIRWYNGLFIGLAPTVLLIVAVLIAGWRVHNHNVFTISETVWVYVTACIAYAAIPSWQDFKIALVSSWLVITVGMAMAFGHLPANM